MFHDKDKKINLKKQNIMNLLKIIVLAISFTTITIVPTFGQVQSKDSLNNNEFKFKPKSRNLNKPNKETELS